MTTQVLACDMSALTADQRERHAAVAQQVFDRKQSVRELADGYAWQYPADPALYPLIAEFMSLEHRCCPFFHLTLDVEPEPGSIWLRITGTPQVKDFIRAEMLS